MNRTAGRDAADQEKHRIDRLGLAALAGFAAVCLVYWSELVGLSRAAGAVAGVLIEPTRLAGAALWVAGWIWGLV